MVSMEACQQAYGLLNGIQTLDFHHWKRKIKYVVLLLCAPAAVCVMDPLPISAHVLLEFIERHPRMNGSSFFRIYDLRLHRGYLMSAMRTRKPTLPFLLYPPLS